MSQPGEERSIHTEPLEIEQIETALADLQRRMRCLRRALAVMLLLGGVATAGLCYCTVLLPEFPQSFGQFLMQLTVRLLFALGLASLVCLLAFSVLHVVYRHDLAHKRELRRLRLIGL